jgi:TonB-linked SusC/RagA family outer membrane protein
MRTNYMIRFLLIGFLYFLNLANLWAQAGSISGTITDAKGETLPGVSVVIQGSTQGSVTDLNGKFKIDNLSAGKYVLAISYIGYDAQSKEVTLKEGENLTIDSKLQESAIGLKEMVVVGYGTTAKKDLTGAVTSVGARDFNKGALGTPEQLLTGKVAGVQITSNNGQPGGGSRIRIRGGSSLSASNEPLIVVDGVPLDNGTINGSGNPLSLINPNDIENMTILKDASAAAIYGARAANGVIIITTKKGVSDGKIHVDISSTTSLSKIIKTVDVLNADEFRTLVTDSGTAAQKKLLGTANTDWQKEIYRLAWGTDNTISISGGVKALPYRLSIGYYNQEGVLKRSQMDRKSIGLNLNPTFLDNHIKVDLTTKFANTKSWFADQGAIGSAVSFDPTKPVYPDTSSFNYNPGAPKNAELTDFGGYYEWTDPATGKPNVLATRNPVGLLYQKEDIGNVNRFIGNIGVDYKVHWFPDLKVHVNAGTDMARSNGNTFKPAEAASSFTQNGEDNRYEQMRDNYLFEGYVNYYKEIPKVKSKVDFTAGYSKQYWSQESPSFPNINALGDTITQAAPNPSFEEYGLRSFFGRLNYSIAEKYLFTFNFRHDRSSRFDNDVRGGNFPSAAFAWRVKDEKFLKNVKFLSDLKLRLGYGVAGQQDGIGNYGYIANYAQGTNTAQYQLGYDENGNPQYYYALRPAAFNKLIQWETTTTYNGGLDFAFFNGRISASVDYFRKYTDKLIVFTPIPAGANFSNNINANVGKKQIEGIEGSINLIPVVNKNLEWQLGFNATYIKNEITKLYLNDDPNSIGIPVGGISGGTGNNVQLHAIDNPANSFFVYKQKYGADGKPIGGTGNAVKDTIAYEDLDNDGKISESDRYIHKNPEPRLLFGLNSNITYKGFFIGFSARMQRGHYIYNNVDSRAGNYANVDGSKNYLNNITSDYYNTDFERINNQYYLSDYYIQKADFIKMDYINAGYTFKNIFKSKMTLRTSGIVQNVFIITDYSGIDPEISGGIDNNIYPRPRVYSLSFNLTF